MSVISQDEINNIVSCKNFAIEHLLIKIYKAIENFTGKKTSRPARKN